jgi:hypothetical protein
MASGSGSVEDTTSTLVDSGSSFAVTYNGSSGGTGTGGFGRYTTAAASEVKSSSGISTIGSSAAQAGPVVVYGTTLISQPKRPTFGVGLGLLGNAGS